MKKIVLWSLLLCAVTLAWCFHKPNNTQAIPLSGDQNNATATGDDETFDPKNFDDPEVKEVFGMLEELVAEEEAMDEVESGAVAEAGAQ